MFAHRLGGNAWLEPLEPWQATELATCVDRARDHLAPWTVLAARVVDMNSARALLQHYAIEQAHDRARYFGIRIDGTLVGGALFRRFDPKTRVCEIGGWLTPDAEGRGLITQAFRHMIGWALGVRGMSRVELRTSPKNIAALAIALRLRMTHDATLRNAFTLNGTCHDSEVWSILANEWPTGPVHCGRINLPASTPAIPGGHVTSPPPAIVAAIIVDDGKVLMVRRRVAEASLSWQFPAGEMEPSESAFDTAIRESAEETGLKIVPTSIIGERHHPATGRHMIYVGCVAEEGSAATLVDDQELDKVEWCTWSQVTIYVPSGLFEPVSDHLKATLVR